MKTIKLITPEVSKETKNIHLEKNLTIFAEFGVENTYFSNEDLLRRDLKKYDCIYLNWFENIDGGKFYMPPLRYVRRIIQLNRIKHSEIKVIFCKHNRFPHNTRYPGLSRSIYKKVCDIADIIVAFNNDADSDLKEVFPTSEYTGKIRVIPPVNYIGAYPLKPESALYEKMQPYQGQLIIGFMGKILPYKNVELIIRAAMELSDKEIHFVLAGEPASKEYGERLMAQIDGSPNITAIFERIPDDEMQPLLDICDVFIMPYDVRSASNSGTGRLAFSYARTVISPDISSMKEIPSDLIYKYHYDIDSEHYAVMLENIKKAYAEWKSNSMILKNKGAKLKDLMEHDYSAESIKKKYFAIFEELFPD